MGNRWTWENICMFPLFLPIGDNVCVVLSGSLSHFDQIISLLLWYLQLILIPLAGICLWIHFRGWLYLCWVQNLIILAVIILICFCYIDWSKPRSSSSSFRCRRRNMILKKLWGWRWIINVFVFSFLAKYLPGFYKNLYTTTRILCREGRFSLLFHFHTLQPRRLSGLRRKFLLIVHIDSVFLCLVSD